MSSIINALREIASAHGLAMLEMSSGKRLFGFPTDDIGIDDEAVELYDAGPAAEETDKSTIKVSSIDAVFWIDHDKLIEPWARKKCKHHGLRDSDSSADCSCRLRDGLFGVR